MPRPKTNSSLPATENTANLSVSQSVVFFSIVILVPLLVFAEPLGLDYYLPFLKAY